MAAPEPALGPPARHRPPGRPRRADVEELVLGATTALLAENGVEGTTMNAIIERSGVARATVFLRWPNRHSLITAAIRRAMGPPVLTMSGDVERDLRRAAERLQGIFGSADFRAVFPALMAGLTTQVGPDAELSLDAVAPGRPLLVDEYRALAQDQGLRDDIPADVAVNVLIGSHIGQYLATGEVPTAEASHQMIEIILDGLRVRPVTPS